MREMKKGLSPAPKVLLAAWHGVFAECTIRENNNESWDGLRIWFGNILEILSMTGQLSELRWPVIPTIENFLLPESIFSQQILSRREYKNYPNLDSLLREAFAGLDEAKRIKWINTASDLVYPDTPLSNLFYSFACGYEGNELSDKAYEILARNPSVIKDTTPNIIEKIRRAEMPREIKANYFVRVARENTVPPEVRRCAGDLHY